MSNSHFLILSSWSAPIRNGDVQYPFRVDSDFLAWTHMDIEWAMLLVDLHSDERVLFFDEPTEQKRQWESIRWNTEKIRSRGFMWTILPRSQIQSYLDQLRGEFLLPDHGVASTEKDSLWIRSLLAGKSLWSAQRHLIEKRLFKSREDIAKIKRAIEITEKTYNYITTNVRHWMYEYEIEAMIAYQFRLHRGTEAFPTIVASWPNACTLHYTAHDCRLKEWDLILLDFGIEIDGYGADISRTFPVSWTFSPRQQLLYDAVCDVKMFAEQTLKPGMTRKAWNIWVKEYMYRQCENLGLPNIEKYTPLTNPYFPHSIGHFLGLDTHDIWDSDMPLVAGMVLTIEPGIYIRHESIGIRIEDDYLVTANGCERL